jgi:hypothetical protein
MSSEHVGGYVPLTVLIRKTWGDKDMAQEITNKVDYDKVVRDLTAQEGPNAEVACSVSAKVSDSLKYGPGTWDKIPISVEVFCSVKLACTQNQAKLESAKDLAHDIAATSMREHLFQAFANHVTTVKTLYGDLFKE